MAARSEKTQLERQLAHEQAVAAAARDAAGVQIADARQQVADATARAADSDVQVRTLQEQLRRQGLSQHVVLTLNQQLREAVQKANTEKEAVKAANTDLRRQLEEQAHQAHNAAQAAETDKQGLTERLEALQRQASTTGHQNEALQAQIAQIQGELRAANLASGQRLQEAAEANQLLLNQLQQAQEAAGAQAEEARRRTEVVEIQLEEARENGNTTAEQLAALQLQLRQEQDATRAAEVAQRDAVERANAAQQARREAVEQARQEATEEAERARTEADTANRARLEAETQVAAAEQQARTQQREIAVALDILKRTLNERLGHVLDKINEELGEDQQVNLNRQADGISDSIRTMRNAESFNGINADIARLDEEITRLRQQAEAQRQDDRERAQADELSARQRLLESAIGNFRQQLLDLHLKINTAPISGPTRTQLHQEVIDLTDVLPSIRQMDDDVYIRVRDGIQSINERLGTKIRTFIAMKGGGNKNGNFEFEDDKTVTYTSRGQAQSTTTWGPFTSTFDYSKTNLEKFNDSGIQTALVPLTTVSKTVVIFGYGYSGSGKTYTLLGKRKKTVDQVFQAIKSQYELLPSSNVLSSQDERIIKGRLESILQSGDSGVAVNLFELYTQSVTRAKRMVINDDAQRAIDRIRDYTNLKSIIEKNTADLFDVPGITHLAIEDFIKKNCTVSVYGVYEMYNENYSVNARLEYARHDVSSKYAPEEFTQYTVDANSVLGDSRSTFTDKINAFNDMCIRIETFRKRVEHIMPTPNNPESSRGHLFIHLKIQNQTNGSNSNLIICDMGGRENPNEIWNTGKYCMFYTNNTIKPIIRGETNKYYDDNMAIQTCSNDPVTAGKVFSGENTSFTLATAMASGTNNSAKIQQGYILKTIKQGFYINDSINELLRFFKYERDTTTHTSGWDGSKTHYNPAIIRTPKGPDFSRLIGIKDLFTEFSKLTPDNIKYCTFACIRPEETFDEDSKQTMNFATQVNSCPDARPAATVSPPPPAVPRAAAAAGHMAHGGGSIRRHRRRKNHAVFKTLKKSRLVSSASDSALASDSNSVKVKHKTRNHKKHNTRNNTVNK